MSEENKQEKIRKVYLDDLPRYTYRGKEFIDYLKSIGYKVLFIYDDIMEYVEIVDYDRETQYLTIKYLDKELFKIFTGHFKNCYLGKLLGKHTSDFKIEIGQVFKDDERDITIIDREIRTRYKKDGSKCNDKWYKYKCNKCGNEDWIIESNLLKLKQGCNACCHTPRKALLGVNTIYDTDKWMIDLGISEEDAKKYTRCSSNKIIVTCPNCGIEKTITIGKIYYRHSIGCICGDGISYPEKFMFNLLEQLGVKFITQLSKANFKWCDNYKYDFYFKYNGESYIIEINGIQHYEESPRGRSLKEEQENDRIKKELALKNGIKEGNYTVINCRKSELEFIKNSILSSKLNEIFNLSNIDWNKVEEFALSNRIKEVCDYWNSGIKSTKEIGEIMKLSTTTISTYLKRGNNLKWCYYNVKEEMKNNGKLQGGFNKKQVEIFKDGISLGIFSSCTELERKSEELFGVKLNHSNISLVTTGKVKHYKGFTFQYR